MISIIIPTFNSASTVQKCIESIIDQSYESFEILIMDGVSTDATATIVQSFNDKRISFLSETDKGIYDAMNKGVAIAKGDYLLFLGSDDTLYNKEVLQLMANKIKLTKAMVIYGNVKMQGNSNLVKDGTIYGGEFDLKRLLIFNIPHQAMFYHQTVFKKIGNYNTKYKIFADHDFNLRAKAKFKFTYVEDIISNFTVGGASTTLTDKSFELDKIKNFINYFVKQIHRKEFTEIRLYIKEAALNRKYKVAPLLRAYCLIIYAKLKLQSLIV